MPGKTTPFGRSLWSVTVTIAALVGVGPVVGGSTRSGATEPAIVRLQVTGGGGTTEGTAFLIHQARTDQGVVQYFVTAAHLFNPEPLGERRILPLRIRLVTDTSTVASLGGSDVRFPGGTYAGLDIAVLKAMSSAELRPVTVSAEPPRAGDMFLVKGYQGNRLTTLTERVRARSTRLVIGDRTAADVSGLMGAPAMTDRGVFGLVSECSSTRAPVVTLLEAAGGFLSRVIPGWRRTS